MQSVDVPIVEAKVKIVNKANVLVFKKPVCDPYLIVEMSVNYGVCYA